MTRRALKTAADYMRIDDDTRVELIQGEFFVTPSPTYRHQAIVANLVAALHSFATRTGFGRVLPAPFDVVLSEHNVVQPDIVFVAAEHMDRIRERLYGAPDVAIEILSPANVERDRIVKRDLYRRQGVPEYWIVDPEEQTVEVLVAQGVDWHLHGIFTTCEELTSPALPGLRLPLESIFT